ncbi:hypothetical protein HYW17_00645 [Candidatus Uhrbacteria bacterium]|nr:hypothetical protein [Candidatus Uhrbacteria bacterium]
MHPKLNSAYQSAFAILVFGYIGQPRSAEACSVVFPSEVPTGASFDIEVHHTLPSVSWHGQFVARASVGVPTRTGDRQCIDDRYVGPYCSVINVRAPATAGLFAIEVECGVEDCDGSGTRWLDTEWATIEAGDRWRGSSSRTCPSTGRECSCSDCDPHSDLDYDAYNIVSGRARAGEEFRFELRICNVGDGLCEIDTVDLNRDSGPSVSWGDDEEASDEDLGPGDCSWVGDPFCLTANSDGRLWIEIDVESDTDGDWYRDVDSFYIDIERSDPCAGVVCSDICSGSSLITSRTCSGGACGGGVGTNCAWGCSTSGGAHCNPDPCAGRVCSGGCPNTCSGSTLITGRVCNCGSCTGGTGTSCAWGCTGTGANTRCRPNPCAGVVCPAGCTGNTRRSNGRPVVRSDTSCECVYDTLDCATLNNVGASSQYCCGENACSRELETSYACSAGLCQVDQTRWVNERVEFACENMDTAPETSLYCSGNDVRGVDRFMDYSCNPETITCVGEPTEADDRLVERCPYGCADSGGAHCNPNPCAGVTCPAGCVAGNVRRYNGTPVVSGGSCRCDYESQDCDDLDNAGVREEYCSGSDVWSHYWYTDYGCSGSGSCAISSQSWSDSRLEETCAGRGCLDRGGAHCNRPPTLVVRRVGEEEPLADGSVIEMTTGDLVELETSASFDPDGNALTFRWFVDEEDVTPDEAERFSWQTFSPGQFRLRVRVTDGLTEVDQEFDLVAYLDDIAAHWDGSRNIRTFEITLPSNGTINYGFYTPSGLDDFSITLDLDGLWSQFPFDDVGMWVDPPDQVPWFGHVNDWPLFDRVQFRRQDTPDGNWGLEVVTGFTLSHNATLEFAYDWPYPDPPGHFLSSCAWGLVSGKCADDLDCIDCALGGVALVVLVPIDEAQDAINFVVNAVVASWNTSEGLAAYILYRDPDAFDDAVRYWIASGLSVVNFVVVIDVGFVRYLDNIPQSAEWLRRFGFLTDDMVRRFGDGLPEIVGNDRGLRRVFNRRAATIPEGMPDWEKDSFIALVDEVDPLWTRAVRDGKDTLSSGERGIFRERFTQLHARSRGLQPIRMGSASPTGPLTNQRITHIGGRSLGTDIDYALQHEDGTLYLFFVAGDNAVAGGRAHNLGEIEQVQRFFSANSDLATQFPNRVYVSWAGTRRASLGTVETFVEVTSRAVEENEEKPDWLDPSDPRLVPVGSVDGGAAVCSRICFSGSEQESDCGNYFGACENLPGKVYSCEMVACDVGPPPMPDGCDCRAGQNSGNDVPFVFFVSTLGVLCWRMRRRRIR